MRHFVTHLVTTMLNDRQTPPPHIRRMARTESDASLWHGSCFHSGESRSREHVPIGFINPASGNQELHMKKMQQGFTLIELMIVIAIIGILAAIAIPQYNDYVTRTQVTGSLAEISGGRTAFEERVQRGAYFTDASEIGLQTDTSRCDAIDAAYVSSDGGQLEPAIRCTMAGNPNVDGAFIALNRTSDGAYECVYNDGNADGVDESLLPEGCVADATAADDPNA
ncbi:MAG: pilin [Halofilum sp. (in: g-proteobacteria)]